MDVRSLLDGQKAAITKDDTNWQLSLSGLMKLGTDEDTRLYEDALISGRKGTHVYAGNGHH